QSAGRGAERDLGLRCRVRGGGLDARREGLRALSRVPTTGGTQKMSNAVEDHMQVFTSRMATAFGVHGPRTNIIRSARSRSQHRNLTTAMKSGRMSFAVGNASPIGSPSKPGATSLPVVKSSRMRARLLTPPNKKFVKRWRNR